MTRVLLVERDPATRDRLALALRRARFELRSSADAATALRMVGETSPDILVLGHPADGMPRGEACRAARDAAPGRPLAVIALLAAGSTAAREVREALLDGADDALPCDSPDDALVEAVRARERRMPAAAPTVVAEAGAGPALADALRAMPRPVHLATLEIEDADAIAAAEGTEALRELDALWRGRIRALVPEQAVVLPAGRGTAVVALPGSTPEPRALLAALAGTGQPVVRVAGRDLRLRSAIGVLEIARGEDAPPPEIALARSRHALALARQGPQPRIHVHRADDAERVLREAHLATLLQAALEQGAFRLVYQPRVRVADGSVAGVEALIRWTLPTTGERVPARRLLAIAEEAGLLAEIGAWALREACRQCAAWSARGIELPVTVNVAPSQFRRGDLVDEVRMALSEAALPGHALTIEVEEGFLQREGDLAAPQIEEARIAGARVAIDDFGTGVGGVPLLERFRVDELKVDQSVLARLPGSSGDRAMLDTALRLARRLGVECAAEGIERPEQLAFLAERGWDLAQGWLISHPLRADDVPGFVRRDPAALAAATAPGA
jgi:EAL domain-containing protein (putative c-di-GMP-specific phosphodiesterase class I)/DNA-binding response OmpR family regulator